MDDPKNFKDGTYTVGTNFILDHDRHERLGFPEIIMAATKDPGDLIAIVTKALEHGAVFVSGVDASTEELLRETFKDRPIEKGGRMLLLGTLPQAESLGHVGLITAGTSDVPYAEECALLLGHLGVRISRAYDAGVAGIHRPLMSLEHVKNADILIVLAGMEGVLPTFMASLTDRPVIGVPTPIGYGFGGEGLGALTTMLQTCVPGVLVVNIGNTVGAAAGALRILKAIRRGKDDG